MDIIFVTTANTDEEARELLTLFGMPFKKQLGGFPWLRSQWLQNRKEKQNSQQENTAVAESADVHMHI